MRLQRSEVRNLSLENGGIPPGFAACRLHYHEGSAFGPGGDPRGSIAFPHSHPHFEIFWFRSGTGLIERGGELIEVGPRTLLVLGPGDVHHWKSEQNLEGALLAVSEAFTTETNFFLPFRELAAFLGPGGSRCIRLSPNEDAMVRTIFEILCGEGPPSSFDRGQVAKALLLILFSKINGFYVGRETSQEAQAGPLTQRFKRALVTHCPPLSSVKEIAQLLKVSRSYLHRAVLHDTGLPPSHLVRERILFEAKRLLLHTHESVSEIARRLGFRSAPYFSSYFHRHARMSPREFRSVRPGAAQA